MNDCKQSVQAYLDKVSATPDSLEFAELMALIDACYDYSAAAFRNGDLHNQAGENEGSCKLFAFAQLHDLDQARTLALFGGYYRDDVLQHPDADSHQNIRNFMRHGWAGIQFEKPPLTPRQS